MFRFLRLPFLIAAGLSSFSAAVSADGLADPSGVWLDAEGKARIRVEHCERPIDRICGYLVWSKDPAGMTDKDSQNPDPQKKGRPVLGMQLILGLAPDDDRYVGQIYDADNGKTYDVKVSREDEEHLKVKGCVLKILCGSQTWTRVSDVQPGQLTGPVDGENGPRSDPEWARAPSSSPHRKGRVSRN
jgi:uncharacterized protein (DUF2147 family)